MSLIRWIKRGMRFQVYRNFYGKLKIKRFEVCAAPQWETVGSLFQCIKYWLKNK